VIDASYFVSVGRIQEATVLSASSSADSRAARDSSFVEILGHYNPRSKPAIVKVDKERVDYWIGKGAQPSDSVRTLMARHLTPKPAADAAAAPKA